MSRNQLATRSDEVEIDVVAQLGLLEGVDDFVAICSVREDAAVEHI